VFPLVDIWRFFCGHMPLREISEHCTMTINHGGAGSMQRAAINGMPQLSVPITCEDQLDNALLIRDARIGQIPSPPAIAIRYLLSWDLWRKYVTAIYTATMSKLMPKRIKACNIVHYRPLMLTKLYRKMVNIELKRESSIHQLYGENHIFWTIL